MSKVCQKCKKDCELIDLECIYDETPLSPSVDTVKVKKALKHALVDNIKPLIEGDNGTCFEELCLAIEAETGSEPMAEKWIKLKEALSPVTAWYTYRTWLEMFGNKETSNLGLVNRESSSGGTVVDEEGLAGAITNADKEILRKENTFKKWFEKHKDDYDCYPKDDCNSCCNNDEEEDEQRFLLRVSVS